MTTPACSPEFPWACPPDIREQMLRAARVDEWMRQGESAAWFDEWKKTRNFQPPQLPQLSASWINEAVKKTELEFKPLDLPRDVAPPPKSDTAPPPKVFDEVNWRLIGDVAKPTPEPTQWSFADLFKNAPPDVQKQLMDLSAELAKWLQPRTVVTPQGTYVVDTVPPDVVIRNILYNLQQSNISPENLYSELIAKLKGEIEQLKEQRAKEEEKNLDKAFERVEEQRRREAELGERLDRLKSMRGGQWRVPALIELPESPFAISPWRWAAPKPIELLMPGRRREVPA